MFATPAETHLSYHDVFRLIQELCTHESSTTTDMQAMLGRILRVPTYFVLPSVARTRCRRASVYGVTGAALVTLADGSCKQHGFDLLLHGPYGALLRRDTVQTFELSDFKYETQHETPDSATTEQRATVDHDHGSFCSGAMPLAGAEGLVSRIHLSDATLETSTGAVCQDGRAADHDSQRPQCDKLSQIPGRPHLSCASIAQWQLLFFVYCRYIRDMLNCVTDACQFLRPRALPSARCLIAAGSRFW